MKNSVSVYLCIYRSFGVVVDIDIGGELGIVVDVGVVIDYGGDFYLGVGGRFITDNERSVGKYVKSWFSENIGDGVDWDFWKRWLWSWKWWRRRSCIFSCSWDWLWRLNQCQ